MLSDPEVRELVDQFVSVKSDPRSSRVDRETFHYKSTRFVPEVVFLDVRGSEVKVIGRLENHGSIPGVKRTMEKMLARVQN